MDTSNFLILPEMRTAPVTYIDVVKKMQKQLKAYPLRLLPEA